MIVVSFRWEAARETYLESLHVHSAMDIQITQALLAASMEAEGGDLNEYLGRLVWWFSIYMSMKNSRACRCPLCIVHAIIHIRLLEPAVLVLSYSGVSLSGAIPFREVSRVSSGTPCESIAC